MIISTFAKEGDAPKRAKLLGVSKTLVVSASGLDRDLNILFAFQDPNNKELYSTQFPTAWRVAYLSKGIVLFYYFLLLRLFKSLFHAFWTSQL